MCLDTCNGVIWFIGTLVLFFHIARPARTFMRCVVLERSCVLTERRQYKGSPGGATNRMANSRWNMSTAHLEKKSSTKR